jgi:hypothetical protein
VFANDEEWWDDQADADLVESVLAKLRDAAQHYFDLAEELGAEPWEVLRACRRLVRSGQAVEHKGDALGRFSRGPRQTGLLP